MKLKGVRDGVKAFTDTLPGLLKALDTVSKLHPFIARQCRIRLLGVRSWKTRSAFVPSRCWRVQSSDRTRYETSGR